METIKITTTKTTEEVIEINLPVYRMGSNNSVFFKVYSPDKCVKVWTAEKYESIEHSHASLAWNVNFPMQDCTEEVFNLAFELASLRLKAL